MATTPPPFFPSYTKTWHKGPYPAIDPTRPELSAKGKSVIITGGGTGIGKQIAIAFALAGASNIGILGRREDMLLSAQSTILASPHASDLKVSYAVADTLSAAKLNTAFKKFNTEFGQLDILIANAGWQMDTANILDADADQWWKTFEINVRGTFNTVRAFLPFSRSEEVNGQTVSRATVLNISSGAAHLPTLEGLAGRSAYASSKIAGAKVIEYLGSEVPGLRVVNVQPGSIQSDMAPSDQDFGFDDRKLPGHFSVWLASPEAAFLHGRFVWVNWDVDELKARGEEITGMLQELQVSLQGPVYYS